MISMINCWPVKGESEQGLISENSFVVNLFPTIFQEFPLNYFFVEVGGRSWIYWHHIYLEASLNSVSSVCASLLIFNNLLLL